MCPDKEDACYARRVTKITTSRASTAGGDPAHPTSGGRQVAAVEQEVVTALKGLTILSHHEARTRGVSQGMARHRRIACHHANTMNSAGRMVVVAPHKVVEEGLTAAISRLRAITYQKR